MSTKFKIQCFGWQNHDDGDSEDPNHLLYRFWSLPSGAANPQLLYYGPEPFTPECQFPLGSAEYNYLIDVTVRIANVLGEYVQTTLNVVVRYKIFFCLVLVFQKHEIKIDVFTLKFQPTHCFILLSNCF